MPSQQVAGLLAGLRMDGDTIVAGLLHDTVEDTALTLQQLEARGSARRPALEMMRHGSVKRDE